MKFFIINIYVKYQHFCGRTQRARTRPGPRGRQRELAFDKAPVRQALETCSFLELVYRNNKLAITNRQRQVFEARIFGHLSLR